MGRSRKDQKKQLGKPIGLEANDWARSEQFVQDIAKTGPQHGVARPRPVSKGRVHKGKTRA